MARAPVVTSDRGDGNKEATPQEVLDAANQLVDEVIKEAEAAVDKTQGSTSEPGDGIGAIVGILRRGSRWQNRAKGVVTRILTQLKICK